MRSAEVVESLRSKLAAPAGRHLYGVLGTYVALDAFVGTLRQATMLDGQAFPKPLSVNQGILEAIPDDEFHSLARDEAKRPEPTAKHVAQAFERFLRTHLTGSGLVVLANLEMLFVYNVELSPLRVMAADADRIVLLLPGRREGGRVVLFPGLGDGDYTLPTTLIAENHLWELDAW